MDGREGDAVEFAFADRFVLQQAWWIASEVARRNPTLTITRTEGADNNPILLVHDGATGPRVQFDLISGIKYVDTYGLKEFSWLGAFAAPNSHEVVKHLESETRFGMPTSPPPSTTKKTIVYRLIARTLAAMVDDRHSWQAVTAQIQTAAGQAEEEAQEALRAFPTAFDAIPGYLEEISAAIQRDPEGDLLYWHQPMWFLLRDFEPVVVLDEGGYAHLAGGGRIDLLATYHAVGRDVGALASIVLMEPARALRWAEIARSGL
jgi:PAS domain-containing protein